MSSCVVRIKAKGDDYGGGWKKGDEFIAIKNEETYIFVDKDGDERMKFLGEFEAVEEGTSPVRLAIRKEIVPGAYGGVIVTADGAITMQRDTYTPDELREAAHILNQIAEALEDV